MQWSKEEVLRRRREKTDPLFFVEEIFGDLVFALFRRGGNELGLGNTTK